MQLSFTSETSQKVAAPETEMLLQQTRQFLPVLLAAAVEGRGEIEAVYPLLVENIELLEHNFTEALRCWARTAFPSLPKEKKPILAKALANLSRIIWAFPEGDPDIDLEIAIACNELALELLNDSQCPELWAIVRNNLALAYSERCLGDTVQNDLRAYAHNEQAKKVFTCQPFPQQWTKLN